MNSIDQSNSKMKKIPFIDLQGRETQYYKTLKSLFDGRDIDPYGILIGLNDVPAGLSSKKIWDILNKKDIKFIPKSHYDWLLQNFSQINENRRKLRVEYIEISDETRRRLNELSIQTNLSPYDFFRVVRNRAPQGLASTTIKLWLSGKNKSAHKEYLNFVIKEWESILLQENNKVEITNDIREELLFHKARTGLSAKMFLANLDNIPDDLNSIWVNGWLTGNIKSADPVHMEFVLNEWRRLKNKGWYSLPARQNKSHPLKPRNRRNGPIFEEISEHERHLLKEKFAAKKITLKSFIQRFYPETHDITPAMISSWMTGRVKKTLKSQLNLVLDKLDILPDKIAEIPIEIDGETADIKRYSISGMIFKELLYHKERTGIGGAGLLKNLDNVPDGLSANMINAWVNRFIRTADSRHVDYVLDIWRKLPDKS